MADVPFAAGWPVTLDPWVASPVPANWIQSTPCYIFSCLGSFPWAEMSRCLLSSLSKIWIHNLLYVEWVYICIYVYIWFTFMSFRSCLFMKIWRVRFGLIFWIHYLIAFQVSLRLLTMNLLVMNTSCVRFGLIFWNHYLITFQVSLRLLSINLLVMTS